MEGWSPVILRYNRDELLKLQEVSLQLGHSLHQWWAQHVKDLGPDIAEELHELQAAEPESSHVVTRRRSKNSDRRQRSKAKREALLALSINEFRSDKDELGKLKEAREDSSEARLRTVDENNTGSRRLGRRSSRSYEAFYSDDFPEPESFQPQAFAVEGEPDFESGEPEDGWEYLRRVKYEAARCPKVVVAQIDRSKLVSKQTPYMPEIPEIPVCHSDLLPSKEWEKQFLKDFSILRMALSAIQAPPAFLAERIPSLRNRAAWEARCFGSDSTVQEEESKDVGEPEVLTARPGGEGIALQRKVTAVPPLDSDKTESDPLANGSSLEFVDQEKELIEPFIERLANETDSPFNYGEASYVIDLGLLSVYVPNDEQDGFFNESVYFISGELSIPDSVAWKTAYPCAGASEPEDGQVKGAEALSFQCSDPMETGEGQNLSLGIMTRLGQLDIGASEEQNGDNAVMKPASSYPNPHFTQGDHLTPDCKSSSCAFIPGIVHNQEDGFNYFETQAEHLSTTELEGADISIQSAQPSSSYFEDEELETAEFMNSLDGDIELLDEVEFADVYGGFDSQIDSFTIGDAGVVEGEVEVNLPSVPDSEVLDEEGCGDSYSGNDPQFDSPAAGDPEIVQGDMEDLPSVSDNEFSEFEDANLPTTDFVNSLIGLEIYRSDNTPVDKAEENFDTDSCGIEFRLDESLEELFAKVFHLTGVSQLPFIYMLLYLDVVSRAALFRHHVSWLENVVGLPKDRALWLIALSAVVDTPLDSQTSAAFRAMLRHCAGVRASKLTKDDEDLFLLSALITIAGSYFGQAEAE